MRNTTSVTLLVMLASSPFLIYSGMVGAYRCIRDGLASEGLWVAVAGLFMGLVLTI